MDVHTAPIFFFLESTPIIMKRDPAASAEDVFDYVETLDSTKRLQMYKSGFNHNKQSQVCRKNLYFKEKIKQRQGSTLRPKFDKNVIMESYL